MQHDLYPGSFRYTEMDRQLTRIYADALTGEQEKIVASLAAQLNDAAEELAAARYGIARSDESASPLYTALVERVHTLELALAVEREALGKTRAAFCRRCDSRIRQGSQAEAELSQWQKALVLTGWAGFLWLITYAVLGHN